MPIARWSLLSKTPRIARSSHCASTASGAVIVYGGELKPRIPVDSAVALKDGTIKGSVHVFDINQQRNVTVADRSQAWRTVHPPIEDSRLSVAHAVPDARVGATMVYEGGFLYLWGGRGGVDMAPLGPGEVGMWRGELKNGDAAGQEESVVWERVGAGSADEPEPRSYHTAVVHEGKIYIHAGCPASGRLSTLYSFDTVSNQWKTLASAPDPARGGTCLAAANLAHWGPVLLRYGGFSGHELPVSPGTLDIYAINGDKWHTVQPSADPVHGYPGARSVQGFLRFQSTSPALSDAVAVLVHGERDASILGHAGAGTFWDDVWLLSKRKAAVDTEGWAWSRADVPGSGGGGVPEARGWFASAEWVGNGNTRVIMHGGLLSSNERSDELWQLRVE